MKVGKVFKVAMINMDINGARRLAEESGVEYQRARRVLQDRSSVKFSDVVSIAECLNLEIKITAKGEQ